MKKIIILLALLPFASTLFSEPVEQKKAIIIANNSEVDFSTLPNLTENDFVISKGSFELMINGDADFLLSDKKWTDEQMANYKQRHKSLPLALTISAFSDEKDASPELQADIFSGRSGDKLLYLYIATRSSKPSREMLAVHFSEGVQTWFVAQGLMAIPDIIQQQNRVELGLLAPIFLGGYK